MQPAENAFTVPDANNAPIPLTAVRSPKATMLASVDKSSAKKAAKGVTATDGKRRRSNARHRPAERVVADRRVIDVAEPDDVAGVERVPGDQRRAGHVLKVHSVRGRDPPGPVFRKFTPVMRLFWIVTFDRPSWTDPGPARGTGVVVVRDAVLFDDRRDGATALQVQANDVVLDDVVADLIAGGRRGREDPVPERVAAVVPWTVKPSRTTLSAVMLNTRCSRR